MRHINKTAIYFVSVVAIVLSNVAISWLAGELFNADQNAIRGWVYLITLCALLKALIDRVFPTAWMWTCPVESCGVTLVSDHKEVLEEMMDGHQSWHTGY